MKDLQELRMKKDSNIYKRGWKDVIIYNMGVNQKKRQKDGNIYKS